MMTILALGKQFNNIETKNAENFFSAFEFFIVPMQRKSIIFGN